jgi:transketolase
VFLNNCQASIVPLQIALSDHTCVDVLNYSNLTPGGALHALGEAIDYKGETFQPVLEQPVLTFALDDLIKHFSLPIPNHIKIDVDGIELKILRGAEEALSHPLVKSVLLEVEEGDRESERIVEFLQDKGLKFHSKHRYVYGGEASPFANVYNYVFQR